MSMSARARSRYEIIAAEPDEDWLVWCETNYEADELVRRLPGCLDVRGNTATARKEALPSKINGLLWPSCKIQ